MSMGRNLGDFQERLTYFKDTDAEKNDMVNELIKWVAELQTDGKKTLSDLENERISRRRFQDEVKQLETKTRMLDARPFILVLIDADADDYIFHQKYLNKGEEGGREVADKLLDRATAYRQTLDMDAREAKIMVRAYSNLKGLEQACVRNRKLNSGADLSSFVIGFNQRQALFDFVDVGDWKEGADNKIRKCLDFYIRSSQCKHVILGACHDSGYAPYLGEYAADPSTNDRITLLKGSVIHTRIAKLGFKHIHQFDDIFAPKDIPAAVPSVAGPSSAPPPVRPASTSAATQGFVNPSPLAERLEPVICDKSGKRVDKTLRINMESPYLETLRKNKLCHWYYLRGKCDGGCDKNHIPGPLNASSFDYLWYVSRGGLCNKTRKGKVCEDPRCVYGHEADCQIGSGGA